MLAGFRPYPHEKGALSAFTPPPPACYPHNVTKINRNQNRSASG